MTLSKAIEIVVASYAKTKNRRALHLLTHRRKVLTELQAISGISPENAALTVQGGLVVIEADLEELKLPPGSLPENEWV